MKVKKVASAVQYMQRPGEGIPLEVTHVPATSTQRAHSQIDISSAKVPDRQYTCDVAAIYQSDLEVQLLFGQSKIGGKGLRSLLAVHMSYEAVHQLLESIAQFDKGIDDLKLLGIEPHKLSTIAEEPSQTVSLNANQVVIGYAAREACMDFYFASAFALHDIQHASRMPVDPVVRVKLATPIILALIIELNRIGPTLPMIGGTQ